MILYRTLLAGELQRYRNHLLRLDGVDRRSRFLVPTSDPIIETHCDGLGRGWSMTIGAFKEGVLRGAVELVGDGRSDIVELAVSVEAEVQNDGVGTELVRRAVLSARNRGIKRITMVCLRDNRRMQRICRKIDGILDFDEDVIGDVMLKPADAMSVWQEWMLSGVAAWAVVARRISRPRVRI